MSHAFRCDAPGCGREIGDGDDRHDAELRSWGRDLSERTLHACSESCRRAALLSVLAASPERSNQGVLPVSQSVELRVDLSFWKRVDAPAEISAPTGEETIALLERLRERCAQEADYEYESSKLSPSGSDCHSKYAAKHVRSIDVRSWLAAGCPDREPRSPR